ncbi:MAG TPA: hypothetical protein VIG75_08035 [Citricoccus sp.]
MTDTWPQPTGDPAADRILSGLRGSDRLSPDEEVEAYRSALDALTRLLDEPPGTPGPTGPAETPETP